MIPSIETICEDLAAGKITVQNAISWLYMHAEGATGELRDSFAMAALQGMLNADYATPDLRKSGEERFVNQEWVSLCGEQAYRFADAMLKAREEPNA